MKNFRKIQPEFKITIIYLVVGFIWILFSGNFVYTFVTLSEDIVLLERYKGWFFIVITALLLYLLIKRESNKQNILLSQLSESKESLLNKSTKLERQNEQLKEYAFLNSHTIRKPLANILGLIQLYDYSKESHEENIHIISKIAEQAEELDNTVRESGKFLTTYNYDNGNR